MKNKETLKVSTLRMMLAEIVTKEKEKEKGNPVDGEVAVKIFYTMIKKREESARLYEEAERDDSAQKERGEIDVIKGYLPPQLGEDEIREEAKKIIPARNTDELPIDKYFNMMADLMKLNPPTEADKEIVEAMASIGIVPGESFSMEALSEELKGKLNMIPANAQKSFDETRTAIDPTKFINGWQVATEGIGSYGTDYHFRG